MTDAMTKSLAVALKRGNVRVFFLFVFTLSYVKSSSDSTCIMMSSHIPMIHVFTVIIYKHTYIPNIQTYRTSYIHAYE